MSCVMCKNNKLECYIKCDQCKKNYCINDIELCKNSDEITTHQPTSDTVIQIHMLLCIECSGKCDVCNMDIFAKNTKLPKEIIYIIRDYLF